MAGDAQVLRYTVAITAETRCCQENTKSDTGRLKEVQPQLSILISHFSFQTKKAAARRETQQIPEQRAEQGGAKYRAEHTPLGRYFAAAFNACRLGQHDSAAVKQSRPTRRKSGERECDSYGTRHLDAQPSPAITNHAPACLALLCFQGTPPDTTALACCTHSRVKAASSISNAILDAFPTMPQYHAESNTSSTHGTSRRLPRTLSPLWKRHLRR